MSDYVVTASGVISSGVNAGAVIKNGIAGESITAGQTLFKDKADSNKMKLLDANVLAKSVVAGVSLHGALAGQPIQYCESDPSFTPGFTIAAGVTVVASATPGALAPDTDTTTGWIKTVLGVGIGSNKMKLGPFIASGVAAA